MYKINYKNKNAQKTNFSKPFWTFSKILVHFQIFHFLKVFFCKRDELSFHALINNPKHVF